MGETIVKQLTHLKQVQFVILDGSAKIEVDKQHDSKFNEEILLEQFRKN